jgi:hypothetical protein
MIAIRCEAPHNNWVPGMVALLSLIAGPTLGFVVAIVASHLIS